MSNKVEIPPSFYIFVPEKLGGLYCQLARLYHEVGLGELDIKADHFSDRGQKRLICCGRGNPHNLGLFPWDDFWELTKVVVKDLMATERRLKKEEPFSGAYSYTIRLRKSQTGVPEKNHFLESRVIIPRNPPLKSS